MSGGTVTSATCSLTMARHIAVAGEYGPRQPPRQFTAVQEEVLELGHLRIHGHDRSGVCARCLELQTGI